MENSQDRKNILIIKPGAIGDLLQLTPVIRALAARYPFARITLIVGSHATASLFQHNPAVSKTIVFDRRREHRTLSSMFRMWRDVRRSNYDLVVHFQRSNVKAWVLVTAALPCRVLVYRKSKDPAIHVVDNYLDTLVPLGISGRDRRPELYLGEDDERIAEDLFTRNGYGENIVIALNPGASHPVNRWPAKRFIELADLLTERLSAKIIIIGGREDVALAQSISSAVRSQPLVMSGKMTLLQLGAVLKRCALVVSGDTGPLHLATAVGARVVALFGAADPLRTGPVGPGHRVLQASGVPCVPCRSRECGNRLYLACMENISATDVADVIMEIYDTTKGVLHMASPKVDMDLCIGCGLCSDLCPKVFELRDDKAWVIDQNACDSCDCQQAVDSCPVTAIAME